MSSSFLEGRRSRIATLVTSYLILGGLVILAIRHALVSADAYTRIVPQGIVSWWIVVLIILVLLLIGLASRRITTRSFYEFVFGIALFLGVWVYCWDVIPWDIGLLVASLATLAQAYIRRVIVHDIYILIGAAGIAIHFAFFLSQSALAAALVGFAIYDIVVGRARGMAETLATSLIRRGVIPGLIVPGKEEARSEERGARRMLASLFSRSSLLAPRSSFFSPISEIIKRPDSVFLGAGDLILPMALVARVTANDWRAGVLVVIGTAIGSAWLGMRKSPKTFPALVPLLAGGGLGLLVAYVIRI
ncbi:MAG: hypothetical protein WC477_04700 [Patescibacteria group bacterium]